MLECGAIHLANLGRSDLKLRVSNNSWGSKNWLSNTSLSGVSPNFMVDHHFPASKRPWNTRHMSLQDLRLQLTGQGCWELRKLNKAKSNKKECPFGGPKVFFLLSFGFFWSCFFFNFFLASKFQFQIVWSDTSWRGMPYDRMIYHRISQPPIYPTNRSCQFSAYHAWSYCSINYHPSIPRSGFSLALFFFLLLQTPSETVLGVVF